MPAACAADRGPTEPTDARRRNTPGRSSSGDLKICPELDLHTRHLVGGVGWGLNGGRDECTCHRSPCTCTTFSSHGQDFGWWRCRKQRGAMVCLPCAVRAAPLSLHRSCKPHKLFLPNSCQLITPVLVHGSHFATCCAMSHAQAVITYETEVSF